jgi:multiple sugar transport system substrate-binding protein
VIELHGITWNHTRGYTPLVACSQRYTELNPHVTITWRRRSLLEFGETPVDELARAFDLLVIDHPFIGHAARHGTFLALDELLEPATLDEWMRTSVGGSTASYRYAGKTWAAPIDAACPVAVWRPDLLAKAGVERPRDWAELLALARRGLVVIPGTHTDAIHHFYMLLHALGVEPGADAERIAPAERAEAALEQLVELYCAVPETCWRMNPIAVHEALAAAEATPAYCPFAFGYSNYSRPGYATHRLDVGAPPRWGEKSLRTTLGGTGLAISARTPHAAAAARFAAYVASGETQRGLYWQAGGQPAHRAAWLDPHNDAAAGGALGASLPVLDAAWVRPRFPGYLHFQDHAAHLVHAAACGRQGISAAVEQLHRLWREARALEARDEN